MAIYRQLHTSFWQDTFILSLTPEEKYFYIYILTNSKTKQCGIYELPIRIAEMETGYNRETVEKLIRKFIEMEKVKYDWTTSEIAIRNWVRYNPDTNPKIQVCVSKELQSVKNRDLIAYVYPMDRLSQQEQEEEEEQEENKGIAKTKFSRPTSQDVYELFQEKNHPEEGERFFNYYEANGWRVGRNPMKNWRAAAANWIKNAKTYADQKRIGKNSYKEYASGVDLSGYGSGTIGEIFGVPGERS
jgi:hypothetical protein